MRAAGRSCAPTTCAATLGLYGSGQIVAVADTGLDTGNLGTIHPDVAGRILQAYALGRAGDWSDYVAHGTHVVGSVLGNGTVYGSLPGIHLYTNTYAGVAPEASLVIQSIADAMGGLGGIPLDIGTLFNQAYGAGARLHTNSWGASSAGDYNSDSRAADTFMWSHKDMLVLFAAGNEGEDYDYNGVIDLDSIGAPGTAKNVLTVGASENYRPSIANTWGAFYYGPPIGNDLRANNPGGMAAFSSRGPTNDGRVKPDVVAPGSFIASMRSRKYVFNDNLESATGGYTSNYVLDGYSGTAAWQLRSDDAHSPSHSWRQVASGSYSNQSMTFLLTPPMDARPTGGYFDVQFWHKYSLSSGEQLAIGIFDANNLDNNSLYTLSSSTSLSSYGLRNVTLSLYDFFSAPSSVRIGFAILTDGASNSTWWLDDIRVDGSDWGTLSSVGLAQPGDALDEAYLMMGGTSMATPLTAGAAALAREWLVENRSFSNPSAALTKAVLINGAADMSPGQYGTGATREIPSLRPNNVTGWGRVDLVGSLNPPLPRQVWLLDNTSGLGSSGASLSYTVTVGLPGQQAPNAEGAGLPGGLAVQPAAASGYNPADTNPAPHSVELKVDNWQAASGGAQTTPNATETTVSLALDDGSFEGVYNLGTTASYQFIWLNRFTPDAAEFPFNLEQIWVMFYDPQGVLQTGSAIDLAVYQDSDGDPANGANLLATYHTSVQAANGVTWSVYNLTPALEISGPGDVLIAAINRYVNDGVTPLSYPATMDTTTSQGRAWRGWWIDIPPDPPILPPDLFFQAFASDAAFTGSWMIRGYGSTGSAPPPANEPLRVTLAWTDYPGAQSAARTLVNDLDLEVLAPDGTTRYYGNAGLYGSGNPCLRSSTRDNCNNVEGVVIPAALPGVYTITVRAYEIAIGPQPFALAASGDNLLRTLTGPLKSIYLPVLVH